MIGMRRKKSVNVIKRYAELKYKKYFKRLLKSKNKNTGFTKNQVLNYGICGFYSKENICVNYNEINSIILTIKRNIRKKTSKNLSIILKTFAQIPVTQKPIQTRMGKGKGGVEAFFFPLKKGEIFLELDMFENSILEIKKIFKILIKKISFDIGLITSFSKVLK